MDRKSNLDILYTAPPMETNLATFESIERPCYLYQLLSPDDIAYLNYIAKNKQLSSQPVKKNKMIKDLMQSRGFKRLSAGTNRLVFKYMEDQRFVVKVAYDHVGLSDNVSELYNQNILKPYCTKVFEVSPCGTVGLFERVTPITNREQFRQASGDIFDIIIARFLGKYILADFGTKFFMNWGVRKNAHPVILDFPYVYELDGAKIYCNRPDINTESGFCGGEIDYDDGFNVLKCSKCGKTFLASELKLAIENKNSDIIISQEDINMIIDVYRGDDLVQHIDTTKETSTYKKDKFGRRKETPLEYRTRRRRKDFDVIITTGDEVETEESIAENTPLEELEPVNYADKVNPEQPIQTVGMYRPTDFNQRVSLDSVPNIDDMYKDLSVKVVTRNGKVYDNGEDMEPDEEPISTPQSYNDMERTRIEQTLEIAARASAAAELADEAVPEGKIEYEDAYDIPYENTETTEPDDTNSIEDLQEDDHPKVKIIIEDRGKPNKFKDQGHVDSAFFD